MIRTSPTAIAALTLPSRIRQASPSLAVLLWEPAYGSLPPGQHKRQSGPQHEAGNHAGAAAMPAGLGPAKGLGLALVLSSAIWLGIMAAAAAVMG